MEQNKKLEDIVKLDDILDQLQEYAKCGLAHNNENHKLAKKWVDAVKKEIEMIGKDVKNKYLKKIKHLFPKSFITERYELVLIPKINVYFRLEDISSDLDFDCKMLEWLSRPAHKGVNQYWQRYIKKRLNLYFNKKWDNHDLGIIYTYLGNNINREKCIEFVKSNFDLSILDKKD